jgi:hypothetical protein
MAGADFSTLHGVCPDRQELQDGGVIERDAIGEKHRVLRHREVFGERAVAMHAEHLEFLAAVGLAARAGGAFPARQVGDDVNRVAGAQGGSGGRAFHDAGDFVPHDSWI